MSRQALEMALEALERSVATCFDQRSHDAVMGRPEHFVNQAITATKEALAQPEQEPVAFIDNRIHGFPDCFVNQSEPPHTSPVYTTPPQRKPLTDEQRIKIVKDNTIQGYHGDYFDAWGIIDDVEAAHGIKE